MNNIAILEFLGALILVVIIALVILFILGVALSFFARVNIHPLLWAFERSEHLGNKLYDLLNERRDKHS